MKTYRYILFDLDGTLITTEELIIACFEFSLGSLGLTFSKEELAANIGLPLREQFKRFIELSPHVMWTPAISYAMFYRFRKLLYYHKFSPLRSYLKLRDKKNSYKNESDEGKDRRIIVTTRDLDHLMKRHMDYQKLIWQHHVQLFPGVSTTIKTLHKKGKHIGIVTSRYKETTYLYLKKLGLVDYFKVIVTPEDTKYGKPAPDPIFKALAMFPHERTEPKARTYQQKQNHQKNSIPDKNCLANTLYVGDTAFDSEAAYRAGVDFYRVDWKMTTFSKPSNKFPNTFPIAPAKTYTEKDFKKLCTL
ncbi:pyrophosphatase PpaX [Spirochaetota bacterium]|nr:pyrophosphatase PpaX [Spirochaetota bacterium]